MKSIAVISCLIFLMIFPVPFSYAQKLDWAVTIGQEAVNEGRCIAIDNNNDIIHAGIFYGSPDFDPGENEYRMTSAGESDIYIQKLDANSNLIWAARIGGENMEEVTAIAVDSENNIYLTGMFSWKTNLTTNNDPAGYYESIGGYDIFIVKLNSKADTEWVRVFPGKRDDYIHSLVLDKVDNPIFAGSYRDTIDFDHDPQEEFYATTRGADDAFICKLSRNGNRLWLKTFGGTSGDEVKVLTIDSDDNIFAGGNFRGTVDFASEDPGSTLTSEGYDDSFILKIDTRANFLWVKHISSVEGSTAMYSMDTDTAGNIFCAVEFFTNMDLDKNGEGHVFEVTQQGYSDFALAKYSKDGGFEWGKHFQNYGGYILPHSLKISDKSEIFISGYFEGGMDCDPGPGIFDITDPYDTDIFIVKLTANGNFLWAGQVGGTKEERCVSMDIGIEDKIFLTGLFQGTADLDPSLSGILEKTSVALFDAIVLMISDLPVSTLIIPNKSEPLTTFPNPVKEVLNIQLQATAKQFEGRVLRADGRVLKTFNGANSGNLSIEFRDFLPGVYFIRLIQGEEVFVAKVIKE